MTTHKAKTLTGVALTAAAALLLSGCGTDTDATPGTGGSPAMTATPSATASSEPTGEDPASTSPSPQVQDEATTVDVIVKGDTITPNGDRIDLAVGETMQLNVSADRAGELHVHSRPEQTLTYPEGASTLRLKISHPGVVEVEDHETGHVVMQLEVR